MAKVDGWKKAGSVDVDSGELLITDPSYIGKKSKGKGKGKTVKVAGFGGDGTYPAYVKKDSRGIVESVRIDFSPVKTTKKEPKETKEPKERKARKPRKASKADVLGKAASRKRVEPKTKVPTTFFGYTDIIWSDRGPEPKPTDIILEGPAYVRHSFMGFGDTKAEAVADLKKWRDLPATRTKQNKQGRWYAYNDYYGKVKRGSWAEVRNVLRHGISRVKGGTDHVFFEGIAKVGKHLGLPLYEPGMGS